MRNIVKAIMLSAATVFGLGLDPALAQHGHEGHDHGHKAGAEEHGEKAGHSHERAEGHGGVITMTKEFHIETVFMPKQVRLYLYDASQNPMHVKHWKKGLVEARGVVEIRGRDGGLGAAILKFVHATAGGYACPMCAGQESSKPGQCGMCGMKLVKQDIPEGTLWSCPMHPDENGKAQGRCGDCGMKYTPQDYLVAMEDFTRLKAGAAKVTFTLKNLPGQSEQTLRFTEKFVLAKKVQEKHQKDRPGHEGHDHGSHDDDH